MSSKSASRLALGLKKGHRSNSAKSLSGCEFIPKMKAGCAKKPSAVDRTYRFCIDLRGFVNTIVAAGMLACFLQSAADGSGAGGGFGNRLWRRLNNRPVNSSGSVPDDRHRANGAASPYRQELCERAG